MSGRRLLVVVALLGAATTGCARHGTITPLSVDSNPGPPTPTAAVPLGSVAVEGASASLHLPHRGGSLTVRIEAHRTPTSVRIVATANRDRCTVDPGATDAVCREWGRERAVLAPSSFALDIELTRASLTWRYQGRPLHITWIGSGGMSERAGNPGDGFLLLEMRDAAASGSWGSVRWPVRKHDLNRDAGTGLFRRVEKR